MKCVNREKKERRRKSDISSEKELKREKEWNGTFVQYQYVMY